MLSGILGIQDEGFHGSLPVSAVRCMYLHSQCALSFDRLWVSVRSCCIDSYASALQASYLSSTDSPHPKCAQELLPETLEIVLIGTRG